MDPDAPLQVCQSLELRMEDRTTRLRGAGGWVDGGAQALAILDTFRTPRSLRQALALLEAQTPSPRAWAALAMTISRLADEGVLQGVVQRRRVGFADPAIHVAMLEDRRRTEAFLHAVRASVRPGDVVVEIGTGTGVLALAAAQAGARRVYAIEESSVADAAAAVFAQSPWADRLTLLRGRSFDLELPEKADLLVSEMLGAAGLEERIVSTVHDARGRLLNPGARLVPARLRVWGQPVTLPQGWTDNLAVTAAAADRWCAWYGLPLAPLVETAWNRPATTAVRPQDAQQWAKPAPAITLAEIDLGTLPDGRVPLAGAGTAVADGRIDAVVLGFEVELAPGQVFSNHPDLVDAQNHWWCPLLLPPVPREVRAGGHLRVVVHGGTSGEVELS